MDASIVIRTYNEEEWLGRTLKKVLAQKYSGTFEVIVIDSGSTDSTVTIAKSFSVKLIEIPKELFTYGRSLNMGAKAAKGKYIVNLSAHAPPVQEHWLQSLLSPFKDKKVGATFGKQIPLPGCNPLDARELRAFYGTKKTKNNVPHMFSNSNGAVRKSLWKSIPFDESLPYAEDQFWAKTIVQKGYNVVYVPSGVVMHSHNDTLKKTYQRAKSESQAITLLTKKHMSFFTFLISYAGGLIQDYLFILSRPTYYGWIIKLPFFRFMKVWGRYRGST